MRPEPSAARWSSSAVARLAWRDVMKIAYVPYPDFTALDLVGPYEVMSRWPDAQVHFVRPVTRSGALRSRPDCDSDRYPGDGLSGQHWSINEVVAKATTSFGGLTFPPLPGLALTSFGGGVADLQVFSGRLERFDDPVGPSRPQKRAELRSAVQRTCSAPSPGTPPTTARGRCPGGRRPPAPSRRRGAVAVDRLPMC
jgi:hypothetical protein